VTGQSRSAAVLFTLGITAMPVGCEIFASFDRSLIPPDGGSLPETRPAMDGGADSSPKWATDANVSDSNVKDANTPESSADDARDDVTS
jgi:hypothetical protein